MSAQPEHNPLTVSAPTAADRAGPESSGASLGPYKLLEKIGEGGFGEVWLAEQREPVKRRVAVKIIKLGMDTRQVVARFEAERQALALMDHPNIAKVLDAGATDLGRPYFVMEWVKGVPVTDYCDREKLETKARLGLFIRVCQAVQHAHQKGIIHRDIKPSNILVVMQDGAPVPKVIDFGIAKATQMELTEKTLHTQLNQFIGTPAYMSPEQAEMTGIDIDTRSDIYSLGVLLYELLTGSTPFDTRELLSAGLDEMRRIIREHEPVRPSTRLSKSTSHPIGDDVRSLTSPPCPNAPKSGKDGESSRRLLREIKGDLDWIVMKCLEKDRTRRYETANGLALDIGRHLNSEPVTARPPSAAYRFQKAWRRNRVAFTAGACVIVAMIVSIVSVSILAKRENLARVHESTQRNRAEQSEKQAREAQAKEAQLRQQAEGATLEARKSLYAADMNLAQQALKMNNLGRARRLLDRHRPQASSEDLRGWEWRYLWQLTRSSALATLASRPTRGMDASFSLDGTRLAVAWWDGQVQLWDVPARRLIRILSAVHDDSGSAASGQYHPCRAAFSPIRDVLAATDGTSSVALYDLATSQRSVLWQPPSEGNWFVHRLTFSPDGSRLVIHAGSSSELSDAVWVINVSAARIEGHHSIAFSQNAYGGHAPLSPDNRRLYLARSNPSNSRYSIRCIDAATGEQLWETEPQRDWGLTALALSPDGRVLVSSSGFEDTAIRVWDAATGGILDRLDGHTGWVCKLIFTRDGQRLISSASDQSIRFWNTSDWSQTRVLRGHTDEVLALAFSDAAQLAASVSKDGDLLLWKDDGTSAADGYFRFQENLRLGRVAPLEDSRLLLLEPGKRPALKDLRHPLRVRSLSTAAVSTNLLGVFDGKLLCHWSGANEILVREVRGEELIDRAAFATGSQTPPAALACDPERQLLAWSHGPEAISVSLARIGKPGGRTELKGDVPHLLPVLFSGDGKYLGAVTPRRDSLRVWSIDTGQIVAAIDRRISVEGFARGGSVLVAITDGTEGCRIEFHDLSPQHTEARTIRLQHPSSQLAISPDGALVASSNDNGQVRLFDPLKGEWIADLHGHLNAARGIAFSPDGQRLISSSGGREAVKLWDVATRLELLTFDGAGSMLQTARWSPDGNVILAGEPWQAWRAPTWEEIAAAEGKSR